MFSTRPIEFFSMCTQYSPSLKWERHCPSRDFFSKRIIMYVRSSSSPRRWRSWWWSRWGKQTPRWVHADSTMGRSVTWAINQCKSKLSPVATSFWWHCTRTTISSTRSRAVRSTDFILHGSMSSGPSAVPLRFRCCWTRWFQLGSVTFFASPCSWASMSSSSVRVSHIFRLASFLFLPWYRTCSPALHLKIGLVFWFLLLVPSLRRWTGTFSLDLFWWYPMWLILLSFNNIIVKKMCYLYLSNCAQSKYFVFICIWI